MATKDDAKELGGILGEIKNAMIDVDSAFKKGSKSLSNIVDIASQFNDYQNNAVKLSSEQLSQLSKKLKLEKDNLQSSQESLSQSIQRNLQDKNNLKTQIQSLQNTKKNKTALADLNKQLKDITSSLAEELTLHDNINDALNDTNKQVDNLEKALNKALVIISSFNESVGSVNFVNTSYSLPINSSAPLLLYGFNINVILLLPTQLG